MKKNFKFFISRGVPDYKYLRKILPDTALIMLERTMYLDIILLLVKYRFQNHWCDSKHNAKVRTVNVYVRCFAIIFVQENIWILFVTLTYLCTDLYYLYEYFFIPHCHQYYFHHQGFSNRDTIIGHVNMCLVKKKWENNWLVPCLAEEKETIVRWFSSGVN